MPELSIWIVDGMLVIFGRCHAKTRARLQVMSPYMGLERTNLCKVPNVGAIPGTILLPGVPKHPWSYRPEIFIANDLLQLHGPRCEQSSRLNTVRKVVNEGS